MPRKLPIAYTENADAAESAHVLGALTSVESTVYTTEFPPLESRKYIPVDMSDPPGAEYTSYVMMTRVGVAKLVTSRGQDLPKVNLYRKQYQRKFWNLGAQYDYTDDELKAAAFAAGRNMGPAVNIDVEMALACREAILRGHDKVAAIGSATSATIPGLSTGIGADVGMIGLLNQPNAGSYTPAVGAGGSALWSLKTPDEKLADLVNLYAAMESSTYKAFAPDTILLPVNAYRNAAGRRMGDGSDESVISVFKKMFPQVTVDSWNYCEAAGTNGLNRAVAFINDPRRVKLKIAIDFEQKPVEYRNRMFKTDCIGRTAGVVTQYPVSIMYMDGI